MVVNKHRPLAPADYAPADLVSPPSQLAASGEAALLNSTTAAAAEAMFAAAARDGVVMVLASGYRSYATQVATYNGYVAARGQADADTASARPGYSEHQTGWAFDIADGGGACGFQPCFADQPAAVWAKANGHRFGFVVRYPWMFHPITGLLLRAVAPAVHRRGGGHRHGRTRASARSRSTSAWRRRRGTPERTMRPVGSRHGSNYGPWSHSGSQTVR